MMFCMKCGVSALPHVLRRIERTAKSVGINPSVMQMTGLKAAPHSVVEKGALVKKLP